MNEKIIIGNNSNLETIAEKLVNKNNNDKVKLLKTRYLSPGEIFSGLVYVKKSNYRRNRNNNELYDLYFQCIDGDGITFRCAMFSTDRMINVKNEVMYITKGMTVEQLQNGIIYYNIDNIIKFTDFKVPIGTFIKEIKDIDRYKQEFLNIVENLNKEYNHYQLINKLEENFNYFDTLSKVSYKDKLGIRLGSILRLICDICNIYSQLNESSLEEISLFNTITILSFAQVAISNYLENNVDSRDNLDKIIESISPISTDIISIVYSTPIKQIDRAKIISILNNINNYNNNKEVIKQFPLEIMYFNILKLVEDNLFIEEMKLSNDILENKHISGVYLI